MTTNEDKRRQAAGQSPLEHMIGYSGEAYMPDQSFDLALFRQLNKEFEANPVVPAPRPFSAEYTAEIGHKRCEMLDRKIAITGQRVLELGCGTGMMSRALAKDFSCEVVGVDICLYEDWHQPVEGNLIQFVHDVTSDNNDILGQFDRVVSFAVFEHIVHPHAALQAVYDVLKPGGKAYIYANLYRGSKASHRYREVFFPWAHLLFENEVWRDFYTQEHGEAKEPAWVNKLTYDQYLNFADRIGFRTLEHFPSAPYINDEFYKRFEYRLAAYPQFDLKHDFIHLVLEKPALEPETTDADFINRRDFLLRTPPAGRRRSKPLEERFWQDVKNNIPEWQHYRPRWDVSRGADASALADAVPWVTFPAIDFLDRTITSESRVFEWGSGGSTLFFRQRAKSVISVEHESGWYHKVAPFFAPAAGAAPAADADPDTSRILLIETEDGAVDWRYRSGTRGFARKSFEKYVHAIEQYEDGTFDFVVVDGRARTGCLNAAIAKVASGGYILLDNANYPRYQDQLQRIRASKLTDWQEIDLSGPGPYSRTPCWQTLAWQRPVEAATSAKAARHAADKSRDGSANLSPLQIAALRKRLAARPSPEYERISYLPYAYPAETVEHAIAGNPYSVLDCTFTLADPVSWEATEDNRTTRLFLQSWDHLDPLLLEYSNTKTAAILDRLKSLVFSWIDIFGRISLRQEHVGNNAVHMHEEKSFIAFDTAVANRLVRLAYMIDILAVDQTVDDGRYAKLIEAFVKHAQSLSRFGNFARQSNHGLLQAFAQCSAAHRMAEMDWPAGAAPDVFLVRDFYNQGIRRLLWMLGSQFAADGVHKEHSPSYHVVMANALQWIVSRNIVADRRLNETLERIQYAARWMHDREGRISNFGDTDLEPTSPVLGLTPVDGQDRQQALFKNSGYWFVKAGEAGNGSYLAQTASFHSRTHKQADTGSFLWRDGGRDIVVDAGRFGYFGRTTPGDPDFRRGFWYSDPRRQYVESTRAHNTIAIDGEDHPRFHRKPFGSGMIATTEKDGLFACESQIPNISRTTHSRLLVLRPGSWLLCLDIIRMRDGQAHDISQYFHIHPDWTLQSSTREQVRFGAPDGTPLYLQTIFETAEIVEVAFGAGEFDRPDTAGSAAAANTQEPFGWWSRRHMVIEPCNAIRIAAKSEYATVATLLSLEETQINKSYCSFNATRRRFRFEWKTQNRVERFSIDRNQDSNVLIIL